MCWDVRGMAEPYPRTTSQQPASSQPLFSCRRGDGLSACAHSGWPSFAAMQKVVVVAIVMVWSPKHGMVGCGSGRVVVPEDRLALANARMHATEAGQSQ
jgi:hypothetical protein